MRWTSSERKAQVRLHHKAKSEIDDVDAVAFSAFGAPEYSRVHRVRLHRLVMRTIRTEHDRCNGCPIDQRGDGLDGHGRRQSKPFAGRPILS